MSLFKKKIPVQIKGKNRGVEIAIMDSNFNPVKEGLGDLNTELLPGLYKVEFKFGKSLKDQIISVRPDQSLVDLEVPAFRKASSLPLSDLNSESQTLKRDEIRRLYNQEEKKYGEGSKLFLMVGGWGDINVSNLLKAFALYSSDGKELIHKFGNTASEQESDAYQGERLRLDPGNYILKTDDDNHKRYLAQMIYLPQGWETQLYFYFENDKSYSDSLSVMILPQGEMDPQRYNFDTVEAAINGLRYGMSAVSRKDLSQMLSGKFRNPMLGLYWLYLHFMHTPDDSINWKLVNIVLNNTQGLIGDLPDIRLLNLWKMVKSGKVQDGPPISEFRFPEPPMIAQGWKMLLEMAESYPDLIPYNSLSARIADKLWGSGVWTIWETDKSSKAVRSGGVGSTRIYGEYMAVDFEESKVELKGFLIGLYQRKLNNQLDRAKRLTAEEKKVYDFLLNYAFRNFYARLIKSLSGSAHLEALRQFLSVYLKSRRTELEMLVHEWVLRTLLKQAQPESDGIWNKILDEANIEKDKGIKKLFVDIVSEIELDQLSLKEVAKALELPQHTVRQILLRINKVLKIL